MRGPGVRPSRGFALAAPQPKERCKQLPKPGPCGHWSDATQPGNSAWHSTKAGVRAVTRGEPVQFRDGFPDFSPWAVAALRFAPGELHGDGGDARLADTRLAALRNFADDRDARSLRQREALVWHHCEDGLTLLLLPIGLHGNIAHTGGASILRRQGHTSA